MSTPPNKATAVRNLQRYLRRLSVERESIRPVPIDGIFAEQTEQALKEFQALFSLPVTGVADRPTWDTLFAEYTLLLEADEIVRPDLFPSTPPNYQTTAGEENAFIKLLQFMLNELLLVYDTLPELILNGVMDEDTSRAVAELQRIHLLPVTGQVDRRTWNRIVREYENYVPSA